MSKYLDEDEIGRVDPFKLKQLRVIKGFTKREVGDLMGLAEYQYARYETEAPSYRGTKTTLSRVRQVCKILDADIFDVCDLIHYWPIPQGTIRLFRRVCQKEGIEPLEAITDIMKAVIKESNITGRRDR
jgi:transcriptional regulator with XRE-family HTH domain